jgi:hypothetical protein
MFLALPTLALGIGVASLWSAAAEPRAVPRAAETQPTPAGVHALSARIDDGAESKQTDSPGPSTASPDTNTPNDQAVLGYGEFGRGEMPQSAEVEADIRAAGPGRAGADEPDEPPPSDPYRP